MSKASQLSWTGSIGARANDARSVLLPNIDRHSWRDKDQVLSKYLTWKSKELHDKLSKEQSQSPTAETADRTLEQNPRRILMVDQIWMWIIDESMEPG